MKHTIPQLQLMNYPTLPNAECETLVYKFGKLVEITLRIGKQDGFYVTGYELLVHGQYTHALRRELSASRKWGEYATRNKAIEMTLTNLQHVLYVYRLQPIHDEAGFAISLKRLSDTIAGIKGIQLTMFKK